MAAQFDLAQLLANPSWEQFDSCWKDDLMEIGAHFEVAVGSCCTCL